MDANPIMQLSQLTYSLLTLLASSALASAQNFNIDIEGGLGTPLAGDGAAAMQTGDWNVLVWSTSGLPSQTLFDTDAITTSVTASSASAGATFNQACSDPELYDGLSMSSSPGLSMSFSGLLSGTYEVYTYASLPNTTSDTVVSVSPSTGNSAIVTTGCPSGSAMHELGITYALHTSEVVAGSPLNISVSSLFGIGSPWVISGVQLVYLGPGSIGTSYCPVKPNSTGQPSIISAVGSGSSFDPSAVSISANNLVLSANNIPAGQPSLFYAGTESMLSAYGGGHRCVGGLVARFSPTLPTGGIITQSVDLTSIPAPLPSSVSIGTPLYFQAWYRDPGSLGNVNLSDALELTFQP